MVGTNDSTNKKNKFYNSTVQVISRVGGDCSTKFGALCTRFVYMKAPVNTQVENELCKIFDFWVQTIIVSDKDSF